MTDHTTTVCPHGPCTCVVANEDQHCSAACSTHQGPGCGCGHDVCDGFTDRNIDQDTFDPHTVGESMAAPGAALDATEDQPRG